MSVPILEHPRGNTLMNLINIVIKKTTGAKIKDIMICGYGYLCVRKWAVKQLLEHGPFPTPCVIQSFAYQHGDG